MKIVIVSYETNKVVKTVPCKGRSERSVEKVDRGMNINLDHDRYFTVILENDEEYGK